MMNLHTLLAATDLTAPSHFTAQRAAMLAQQIGARLEFVHVLDKRELAELQRLLGDTLKERIQSQSLELLKKLANDVGEPLSISAGCHLVEGKILESITKQVDAFDANLLIIGARGIDSILQQFLGTTAERLLRMIQCPVLTVKLYPRKPYQSVLVPIDFSSWSLGAIHLAQSVAPQAKLTLLHAYEPPFEAQMHIAGEKKEEIQNYRDKVFQEAKTSLYQTAEDARITTNWHPIVIHGNAVQRILEQEKERGADLIILGKHGLGMVEELLLGSNARQVLIHAQCDVLIANR
ncbi:MAG: universal stress protein [Nitrosomonadales bacterium]|jgi:nucleotide-binding universal stress UspA family protein|nr:MAG: universal stress protein [Nitrosomonadales bacterium]